MSSTCATTAPRGTFTPMIPITATSRLSVVGRSLATARPRDAASCSFALIPMRARYSPRPGSAFCADALAGRPTATSVHRPTETIHVIAMGHLHMQGYSRGAPGCVRQPGEPRVSWSWENGGEHHEREALAVQIAGLLEPRERRPRGRLGAGSPAWPNATPT